jgi:hypothetical protein
LGASGRWVVNHGIVSRYVNSSSTLFLIVKNHILFLHSSHITLGDLIEDVIKLSSVDTGKHSALQGTKVSQLARIAAMQQELGL